MHTSWSIPGWCGGSQSTRTSSKRCKNSWYCCGIISSKGRSLRSFASIASLLSWRDALSIVSFPFLTVWKNETPLNMTIFPQNGCCCRICGLDIPPHWGYTASGGSHVTLFTVTGASWQVVVQFCDLEVTVFDANYTATSCNRIQGIPRTIG